MSTNTLNTPVQHSSRINFDLSSDATLIKVSIKQYTGRTKDDTLSAQAAAQNNADARVIETFLSRLDKEDRMPIQKIATAARDHVNFHSAVWDSAGWRLVANTNYEKLRSEIEQMGVEFNAAVDNLVANHANLELKARAALGPVLFSRMGFPSAQELRNSYQFAIERQPIVNPADIRLRHISAAAVREIEDSTRKAQAAKVQDAMKQVAERLREAVERIANTLANEDAIFRNTMITNVRELCGIVPALNLTHDPFISRVADEINTVLGGLEPDQLREDKTLRKDAATKADDLLKKLKSYTPTDTV